MCGSGVIAGLKCSLNRLCPPPSECSTTLPLFLFRLDDPSENVFVILEKGVRYILSFMEGVSISSAGMKIYELYKLYSTIKSDKIFNEGVLNASSIGTPLMTIY